MSKLLTLHPSKRHPLTGRRLEAVGVLPNGKVIWPVLGSDDTVPPAEPPEGVTADEWEALGDPGKKAIIRERGRSEKPSVNWLHPERGPRRRRHPPLPRLRLLPQPPRQPRSQAISRTCPRSCSKPWKPP